MTFQNQIDATHPMEFGENEGELECKANDLAVKLVSERHSKSDLVDLVRWLILKNPEGLL